MKKEVDNRLLLYIYERGRCRTCNEHKPTNHWGFCERCNGPKLEPKLYTQSEVDRMLERKLREEQKTTLEWLKVLVSISNRGETEQVIRDIKETIKYLSLKVN